MTTKNKGGTALRNILIEELHHEELDTGKCN